MLSEPYRRTIGVAFGPDSLHPLSAASLNWPVARKVVTVLPMCRVWAQNRSRRNRFGR